MIAIIPARGGSKGLPGKNVKLLQGKPLIAYTIEAALQSKEVDRVIISTDDIKIAEIAKSYGAEVPFMRPDELAGDDAKSIDVYNYTIARLEKEEGISIGAVIILQPTSPLRTAKHIDEAIQSFIVRKADSVISYCQEDHPVFWHKFITEEGKFEDVFSGNYQKNRQDIRPTFYPNGSIYIFKKEVLSKGDYYNENSYVYLMDKKVSVDIDTIEDFQFCEYLLSNFEV